MDAPCISSSSSPISTWPKSRVSFRKLSSLVFVSASLRLYLKRRPKSGVFAMFFMHLSYIQYCVLQTVLNGIGLVHMFEIGWLEHIDCIKKTTIAETIFCLNDSSEHFVYISGVTPEILVEELDSEAGFGRLFDF
ncbi:hypothetical protein L596_008748 [Steinernema carpocapsae]|uniref:Uncharacterized protein n=1 Tax=Steinernema carpocapsae TaxID=34508 RepID=A0A4U5PDH5_STECR|nr:hypothetical protein L596_008748 [Steinernema carpocapsae]